MFRGLWVGFDADIKGFRGLGLESGSGPVALHRR